MNRDPFPATMSCLQYGNSCPSCQQVCLVSDPDGEKVFTGVTFLSLFSKYLSSNPVVKEESLKPPLHYSNLFTCDIYGKRYTSRGPVIAHKIWKHSQPALNICQECPICKKTLNFVRTARDLGAHINWHFKEERKIQCDKCPSSFYKNQHLNRHKKAKHT